MADERFVNITLCCEWTVAKSSPVHGYFRLDLPESFPVDLHLMRFPVRQRSSSWQTLLDTCVDDFFIDCALRTSFIFRLRYSTHTLHKKHDQTDDSLTPETILIDAAVLFLSDRTELSYRCRPPHFESLTFSIFTDATLLSKRHIDRFCPIFLHLTTTDKPTPSSSDFAPPYFSCTVGTHRFNLFHQTKDLETALIFAPRDDLPSSISLHDSEFSFPPADTFRGCGVHSPFSSFPPDPPPSAPPKRPRSARRHRRPHPPPAYVEAHRPFMPPSLPPPPTPRPPIEEFTLLPEREFSLGRSLHCRVWDPARGRLPWDSAAVPRPESVRTRPPTVDFFKDVEEDRENPEVLAMESRAAAIVRWVVSCRRGAECARALAALICAHHAGAIDGWNDGPRSAFRWSFRRCADVITGFHFLSTEEEIFVLETRRDDRKDATLRVNNCLREFPPEVHVLGNVAQHFRAPRLYCCLDRLVKRIEIPISLDELLQIDGLYCRSAENHCLFAVARKLNDLVESVTLGEANERGAFPTYVELRTLARRAVGLYAMPLMGFGAIARRIVRAADFGDPKEEIPFVVDESAGYVPVGGFPVAEKTERERERLTNYVLTRPAIRRRREREVAMSPKGSVRRSADVRRTREKSAR